VSLRKFVTYVLMLITLIEIFFSHSINILQIFVLLSMGVFVMYLMDYVNLYANIIYHYHMLTYIGY
jgi:hypothetical protein